MVAERERKDAYRQAITNYFKLSEENKKTGFNKPTSADIAEPEHYKPFLLNSDIS
jgi:hypothetical protein